MIHLKRDDERDFKPRGTTGKDGKLIRKLPPGVYRVKATKEGYENPEERSIQVLRRPYTEMMSKPLKVGTPVTTATATATATPTPLPTTTAGSVTTPVVSTPPSVSTPASPPDIDTEAIVGRFLDPKASDQVKPEEWDQLLLGTHRKLGSTTDEKQRQRLEAQAEFAKGQIAYVGGDFRRAAKHFEAAVNLAREHTLPAREQAMASCGLGNAYLADGRPDDARKAFRSAISLDSELWMAHNGLGEALTVLEDGKAADSLVRARSLGYQPQGLSLNLSLARNFIKRDNWKDALRVLHGLPTQDPPAEVSLLFGEAYLGQERTDLAREEFTKVIKLDNKAAKAFAARAYYGLAQIEYEEGKKKRQYDKALEARKRAKELDPDGDLIDRKSIRNALKELEQIDAKLPKNTGGSNKPGVPNGPVIP